MKHIYCISGLGADERVFAKFKFPEHQLHFIKWITPEKSDSIDAYAKKLIDQIHHTKPLLIGLSFGGIMCIEIAKLIKTEIVIIISSIKSSNEMPLWMWLSGKIKINKILPMRPFKLIEPWQNYNLGVKTTEEKEMVNAYRKNVDIAYSKWAVNIILNWKNKTVPKNLYHIHGSDDRIFSIKKINATRTISGGGHLMILNKSDEINEYINSLLKNY